MVGLHRTITKEGQSYNSNWKFSPNAARETSSAIATVATAAAAQCVLHHKKKDMPQPTHNYSWILLLPYNKMWAYSRVWEWPHLQLDDLQIVPGAMLLSSSTNS
ncbi:unnamed protein product [Sphagnum jensenii]|uniref:Uncharacterized protein n=1 Tax=Sphagnum jensenii TaxID=128206 RepID=A0ABP1BCG3_9BRYO